MFVIRDENTQIRVASFLLAACIFVGFAACDDEPVFEPTVTAAFQSFVGAVKAGDGGRLWELSPPEFHSLVEKFRTEMLEISRLVREEYPESDRDIALQNLASELYEGTGTPREMFIRMLSKDAMTTDDATDRGLQPVAVKVYGDEAVVETKGGETFRFELLGDEWRCTTLVSQLESWPALTRLRKNAGVARRNIESWRRDKQETTDKNKPAGAFNIVLKAVRRGARVTVYEQLDKSSRRALKQAFDTCAKLQKELERRFPRKSSRIAYLTKRNARWVEQVANEKTLFALLWDRKKFASELPPADGDVTVLRSEYMSDDSAVVIASSAAGERRFQFRRVLGGEWRFANLHATIEREALRFLEAESRALKSR